MSLSQTEAVDLFKFSWVDLNARIYKGYVYLKLILCSFVFHV